MFRLTRGQRNVGLDFAPPAYGVLASAYDAAAGALSGDFVSNPVGVREDGNPRRLLELIADSHSGLSLQVSYGTFDQLFISLFGAAHLARGYA